VAYVAALGDWLLPAAWVGDGGNALANPLQYFLIPLLALLLLGARPAELGLGSGWRVGRVCALWLALPALIWLVLLGLGLLPVQTLVRRLLSNTLQNGFFEEFLLRGALQTRLERLLAPADALIVQALVFGLWHIEVNTRMMDGNLLAGLAVCVTSQAVSGLCLGLVFRRTGNLVAPTVVHVAMNALGQTFG
jgi:membrane protease YdiL (CAAX protease family)